MADLRAPQWALAPGVRRVECGRVVIGGSPMTIMRLTEAGAAVLDRALGRAASPGGAPVASVAERALLARLERRGMLVATPVALSPDELGGLLGELTVVVPVRDDADGVAALLASLAACTPMLDRRRPPGVAVGDAVDPAAEHDGISLPMRTLVVDDASTDPQRLARVAERFGAEVIRCDRSGGPGAARTIGLAAVTTPWVAFLDADTTLATGWLATAGAHLRDDRVSNGSTGSRIALVAPRVTPGVSHGVDRLIRDRMVEGRRTARSPMGKLAAYERAHSPLDLGADGGTITPGTRLSYAPSAAWLVRVDALRLVGGFDPGLRYGEDVDLIWRLVDAGWVARYDPRSRVKHRVRPTLPGWVEQRFRYGTSAAPLAVRHRGALSPVVVSPWSAAAWGLVVVGHPLAGLAVAAGSTGVLARRLDVADPAAEALRLAGRGTLLAGFQLARALIRPWWPVTVVAAWRWRRGRVLAAAALAASAIHGRSAVSIADDVAYSTGVWWGVAVEVRRRPSAVVAALGAVVPGFGGGPARSGDALVKRLRSALGRGERAVGDRGSDNNDDDTTSTGGSSADEPTGDGAQRLGLKKQRRSERPIASKPTEKKNDGGGSW